MCQPDQCLGRQSAIPCRQSSCAAALLGTRQQTQQRHCSQCWHPSCLLLCLHHQPLTRWDVSKLEPLVAAPHSPDNRKTARECSDVKIDRVYIGSCTGGSKHAGHSLFLLTTLVLSPWWQHVECTLIWQPVLVRTGDALSLEPVLTLSAGATCCCLRAHAPPACCVHRRQD